MTSETFEKLQSVGFKGPIGTSAKDVINWLNSNNILRIEPYWRFLGAASGFSWSKSWDVYSDKIEVECATWDELLEIALEGSVNDALGLLSEDYINSNNKSISI